MPEVDILVNNLGIFEPKPFEEIPDEDWLVLRDQRDERGAADPPLPSGDEGAQLGADRLRLERVGRADPQRDDPLRHDQDGPARDRSRRGRDDRRHGHHRELGPARADRVGGRGHLRLDLAGQQGIGRAEFEAEFFKTARPSSLLRRFATVEEVANMIVYVCSPLASATNGAALRVDGGVVRAIV